MREVRAWAQRCEASVLLGLDEAQAAFPDSDRRTLAKQMERLSAEADPLIERMAPGVYARRDAAGGLTGAHNALIWRLAGPGAGWSGIGALNGLGWVPQVSRVQVIAVVGRPPAAPLVVRDVVRYVQRNNRRRLSLREREVTLLECVRCFDLFADDTYTPYPDSSDPWPGLFAAYAKGRLLPPDGSRLLRAVPFLEAAAGERRGSLFYERCERLVKAVNEGERAAAARVRR